MTDEAVRLQRLFQASLELLAVIGADRRLLLVNPAWERVLGYRPADLVGRPLFDLVHPDDVDRSEREAQAITAGRASPAFENRLRHIDGRYRWVRWSTPALTGDNEFYAAGRDVTGERLQADELHAAVRRLDESQRHAAIGSFDWRVTDGHAVYSQELFRLLGLGPEHTQGLTLGGFRSIILPADRAPHREAMAKAMLPGAPPAACDFRTVNRPDRVLHMRLIAVHADDGALVGGHGTIQDVTELRALEARVRDADRSPTAAALAVVPAPAGPVDHRVLPEPAIPGAQGTALHAAEARLAEAERLAGMGSFEVRLADAATTWSPGTYRLFGMDPSGPPMPLEQALGRMSVDDAGRARAALRQAAVEPRPFEFEFGLRAEDGSRRRLLATGESFLQDGEPHVRGALQDVTRLRRSARQQEEMARLGQRALEGLPLGALADEICDAVRRTMDVELVGITRDPQDAWLPPIGDELRAGITPAVSPTATFAIPGRGGPFGHLWTLVRGAAAISADDRAFLGALASLAAAAVERVRGQQDIAELAAMRGRLVADTVEAEERARRNVSEDLHDGVLQDLLAARQDLVEAEAHDESRDEMLGHAREGVERAVGRLREAVSALHPVVLQHGGLAVALRAAADQAARQGGFTAIVEVDPDAVGHRDELVLSVARELLTNAAKHAGAATVRVTVRRARSIVVLEVADDGTGLDPETVAAAPRSGHIGLSSLAHRVEAVGGTFDPYAAPGPGTTIRAVLPVA